MTRSVMTLFTVAALVWAAVPSFGSIFEEDFESYPSPTSLQGGTAADPPWFDDFVHSGKPDGSYDFGRQTSVRDITEVHPGDGSQTIPVSPFGPSNDTKVMEYYDNDSPDGGDSDRRMEPAVTINPNRSQYPITLTVDFRIDADWEPDAGGQQDRVIDEGRMRMILQDEDDGGDSGFFLNLISTEGSSEFEMSWVNFQSRDQFLVELEQGKWYRLEMEIEAPDPDDEKRTGATLTVQEWTDGASGPETLLSPAIIEMRQPAAELNFMVFQTAGPGDEGHYYVDNINLSAAADPMARTGEPDTGIEERAYPPWAEQWTERDRQAQRKRGEQLLQRIRQAVEDGESMLRLQKAHYRFAEGTTDNSFINLEDVEDLTIDFQGSDLWFEQQVGLMRIMNSRNVTVRNVSMDMDPLPFTQGKIVAVRPDRNEVDLVLPEAYRDLAPRLLDGQGKIRGALFDMKSREFKVNQHGFLVRELDRRGKGVLRLKLGIFGRRSMEEARVEAGDLMAVWKRGGRAIRVVSSGDITLENVNMYAAGFVVFNEITGGGANVYRNCNIVRRPGTTRLIAGNADAFNSACMKQGPTVESCHFQYVGDDSVNIHTFMGKVYKQPDERTVWVDPVSRRKGPLTAGTILHFYEYTESRPYIGEYRVVDSDVKGVHIGEDETLFDVKPKWRLLYGKSQPTFGRKRVHVLTLDRPIEVTGPTVYHSDSHTGSGAVLRDNTFEHILGRGMRIQAPHVTIENNVIRDTAGYGISLEGNVVSWGEGSIPHHVTIRNNKLINNWKHKALGAHHHPAAIFINTRGDPAVTRLHRGSQIIGNEIVGNQGPGIMAIGAVNLVLRDNRIVGHGTVGPDEHPAIVLRAVKDHTLEGNAIVDPGPHGRDKIVIEPLSTP